MAGLWPACRSRWRAHGERLCGSGLEAARSRCPRVKLGRSRHDDRGRRRGHDPFRPYVMGKPEGPSPLDELRTPCLGWRFINPRMKAATASTPWADAENAPAHQISRTDRSPWPVSPPLQGWPRIAASRQEIVKVCVKKGKTETVSRTTTPARRTTMEILPSCRPPSARRSVTAGNAAGIKDGDLRHDHPRRRRQGNGLVPRARNPRTVSPACRPGHGHRPGAGHAKAFGQSSAYVCATSTRSSSRGLCRPGARRAAPARPATMPRTSIPMAAPSRLPSAGRLGGG